MPSSGHERSFVYSIGATGVLGLSSDWAITTRPPQQSTAALKPLLLQAARKAWRPPEHVPKTPTLPLQVGSALRKSLAPAASPTTWSSAAPPAARALAATSSGDPWPKR